MTTAVSTNENRRRSATTVVGAIAAVGAAVAVAGLGTMGGFTDSTAPVNTKVDTGVLSIDVSEPNGSVALFGGGAMVAGDSRTALLDLANDGTTPLSSVTLTSWATQSSVLNTDTVNGLQLKVDSCSVGWTVSAGAPTCPGTVTSFFSGPIIGANRPLVGSAVLVPGVGEHLALTATLPAAASGDAFEGATSAINFQFTGVQRTGGAR